MFRQKYPVAWSFHRNTSRWVFNVLQLDMDRRETPAFKELPDAPNLPLPEAPRPDMPLAEAIRRRLSCRRFDSKPMSTAELGAVLFWSYGRLDTSFLGGLETVLRPVPSGGGLYPLELYAIVLCVDEVPPGIYHYDALGHSLERIREGRIPENYLADLFMGQPYVARAAVVLVVSAVFDRSLWKYEDRGYRYILIEAGHLAQNANLVASALGLGSLDLAGFFDADVAQLLQLDPEEEAPLYGIAVGRPALLSPDELRVPEEGTQPG